MIFFDRFTEGVIGTPSARFYRQKKERGGYRIIGEPNDPLLEIQGRFLGHLQNISPLFPNATAAKAGEGAVRNARRHAKESEFIFTLDLVNAFYAANGEKLAEIIAARTAQMLHRRVPAPSTAEWQAFLRKYALARKGGLVQGYATSPLLHDWYCEVVLDKPIRDYLNRLVHYGYHITYSRYVDDLTFSSPVRITRDIKRDLRLIVRKAGYLENHRKTQASELRVDGAVRVTGCMLDRDGGIGIPRKKLKEMERMLSFAVLAPLTPEIDVVIGGKLRYLLDVLRGAQHLNALEFRTVSLYRDWCLQNGRDARWPTRILARKPCYRLKQTYEKRWKPKLRPEGQRTKRTKRRFRKH